MTVKFTSKVNQMASGRLLMFSTICVLLVGLMQGCTGEAAGTVSDGNLIRTVAIQSSDVVEQESVNPNDNEKLSVYGYKIINIYPHDEDAFTQGLFFHDGYFFESTGLTGLSSIRKIVPDTGEVVMHRDLASEYFGEGAVAAGDRIISLTWKAGKGFIHSLSDFSERGEFAYQGEGWGIAYDGSRLIVSDGTSKLRFLDPDSFEETGHVNVTLKGKPIRNINELEWIVGGQDASTGLLYANIWQTDWIAMIELETGRVSGLIDMTGVLPEKDVIRMRNITRKENVLNGIAWDDEGERLFVTGKNWPKLFEIELVLREVQ